MAHAFCLWSFLWVGTIGALCASCQDEVIEALPDAYVGIGVELTIEAAGARVVRTIPGGPASQADIESGDVILAVGDVNLRGESLASVFQMLRGKPGTQVEILVRTKQEEQKRSLTRKALERSLR